MSPSLNDEAAPLDHWQAASVMRLRLNVQRAEVCPPALLGFAVPEQPGAFRLSPRSPG
jgi:hypothetical protein